MQLTNADRRTLLESFRTLAHGWSGDDSGLICWATTWAASLAPTFGFESGLGRDVFFLADVLRQAEAGGDVARLARGGLAYLHQHNQGVASSAGPFGLLDDSFVAGYAAHAIRQKSGADAAYHPPKLNPDEKAAAEKLFEELWGCPEGDDDTLPGRADAALAALGHLAGSGLFRRLRLNVSLLSRVMRDKARPEDQRKIARAALHYVATVNDIIPGPLGLLGFLDDFFIADLAVGLIDDSRAPWMDLIDSLVGAWPFLNMASFGDGRSGAPVSEFLMVNSALTCPALRRDAGTPLTHLVVPATGPLPLLLGFIASLGELLSARRRAGSPVPFEVGQKVLVDGNATAIFMGCRSREGTTEFGLNTPYRDRGEVCNSIRYWGIDQLYRLVPADSKRAARGRLSVASGASVPLGALDYLFVSAEPITVPPDLPQVVVVAAVGESRSTAESVSLFGHRLCDALPMGHLSASGDAGCWSPRFGSASPAVLVVPDLDRACEYVEAAGDAVALTVVDASGHNSGRLASLNRLLAVGGRVLAVVPEGDADDVISDAAGLPIWEWTPADFESLCVGSGTNGPADPVRSYERELVRAATAGVEVVRVEMPGVEEVHRSLTVLKRLAEERGEDLPRELGDALGRSWSAFCRLMRCPFRLSGHPELEADLMAKVEALTQGEDAGGFLTTQEVEAIVDVQRRLRALLASLRDGNPKEQALAALRERHPGLTVVCGDVPLLHRAGKGNVLEAASALDLPADRRQAGYVVTGWFGIATMKRLLRPPFATPLHLVLCGPEAAWHDGFRRRVRAASSARSGRADRGRLFPGLGKWPDPSRDRPAGVPAPVDVEAPEAIESILVRDRRRRLADQAMPSPGEEAVRARLVAFEGGHAFLTDDYQAKVATHLVAGQAEAQEAVLRLLPATGLRRGDLLLFLRGSSSDVIRQVADRSLPAGERERAALWRRTLLAYRQQAECPVEAVWEGLRRHGCPLSLAAIEVWFADQDMISPASIDRELKAILELTQNVEFREGLDGCRAAIRRVRGEHLKASREIARRVIERAVAGLKASAVGGGPVDLGEGIVLARVSEIDGVQVTVRRSAANRLLENQP